jgi:hypothetical protein
VNSQRYQISYRGSLGVLKITSVTKEDSGDYWVIAENPYGKAQNSARVEVFPLPPAPAQPAYAPVASLPRKEKHFESPQKAPPRPTEQLVEQRTAVVSKQQQFASSQRIPTQSDPYKADKQQSAPAYYHEQQNLLAYSTQRPQAQPQPQPARQAYRQPEPQPQLTWRQSQQPAQQHRQQPQPQRQETQTRTTSTTTQIYRPQHSTFDASQSQQRLVPDYYYEQEGSPYVHPYLRLPEQAEYFVQQQRQTMPPVQSQRQAPPAKGAANGSIPQQQQSLPQTAQKPLQTANQNTKPPQFMQMPQSQIVKLGENAVFSARAVGQPTPTISWTRADGKALPNDPKKYQITGQNGQSQLTIVKVAESDVGAYLCAANNPGGAFQAQFEMKLPEAKKPQFVTKFPSVTVNEGESVTLSAKAVNDVTKMEWSRDGAPLKSGGNYKSVML